MAEHSRAYRRIMARRRKRQILKRRITAGVACGAVLIGLIALGTRTGNDIENATEAEEKTLTTLIGAPQYTADEWEQVQREKAAYEAKEQAEAEALRQSIEEYNEAYQKQVEAEWLEAQKDPYRYSFMEPTRKQIEPVQIGSLDWAADDAYLLARIAMAEAEGESTETKALVILTVLNRVWSPKFPGTIREVIFEENQFTPIKNGRWDRVEPNSDCWEALDLIYSGWNESEGALYFETTTDEQTWHNENLYKLFESGNITFYTEYAEEADQ